MNIFDPALRFEGERFLLRPLCESDLDDLFAVYSDKRALPYFNSLINQVRGWLPPDLISRFGL